MCLKPVLQQGSPRFAWGYVGLEAGFVLGLGSELNAALGAAVRAICSGPWSCIHLWSLLRKKSLEELAEA